MTNGIKFLGIGQSLPTNIVTNKKIESLTLGSNAKWIEDKLGIQERRISTDDTVVSLGSASATEALKDSDLSNNDIDLIIVNTSSADKLSPSVACMIQDKLGLTCPAFDINAVCTGFIYALELTSLMSTKYKNILIVSTETYSNITDWDNRNSCFFGDGSAAVVVTGSDKRFHCRIGADGKGWNHFNCDRNLTFNMNGKEVYKFGTRVLPTEIKKLMEDYLIDLNDVDWVVPHQPSHNVLKETAKKLKISNDKIYYNMKRYANTAGASVPMALYDGIKTGKIKNGNNLILAAIGSGWTYGVCYLKLEYK
jgi:3-oxoacyl-[acyl-carrier-protein] synthase III